MSEKKLMKGNEVVGEASIRAGCRYFFGYPITPQNDIPAYMSRRLPEVDGVFLQAESEVAASNMVYGASGAGARVLTSSSSPGISLKAEGISYIAGAELPAVIVNMMRSGPGLGGIQPSQADYFQATKGMAHGDFRLLVLAPSNVQELADLTYLAFELADKYRNPVFIMADGFTGQMMEPVEIGQPSINEPEKNWAVRGTEETSDNLVTSIQLDHDDLEAHNEKLQKKYSIMEEEEVRYEGLHLTDADIVLIAFGIASRVVQSAVERLRNEGVKAGMFRPKTLFPFPKKQIEDLADKTEQFLVVEMNNGQMLDDVKLAVEGRKPVHFHNRMGGNVPSINEVRDKVLKIMR